MASYMGINPMHVCRPVRWQREYAQWSIEHAYVHWIFQLSIGSNGYRHVHWTFDLSIGSNGQECVHWTFGCAVNKLFRMTSFLGHQHHAGRQACEMAKGVSMSNGPLDPMDPLDMQMSNGHFSYPLDPMDRHISTGHLICPLDPMDRNMSNWTFDCAVNKSFRMTLYVASTPCR
jgi:hypothetical protein